MLFRIDPISSVGLAEQIAAQVRGALASGAAKPGDRLPPARQLAAGLEVNMHTVLRAYATLRDEGLIDIRPGRGAQIRADADGAGVALSEQIRQLIRTAGRLGISRDELIGHIKEVPW